MTDAILSELFSFPRTLAAVAESVHALFPKVRRSIIIDEIDTMATDGRIASEQVVTATGRALLVWRK